MELNHVEELLASVQRSPSSYNNDIASFSPLSFDSDDFSESPGHDEEAKKHILSSSSKEQEPFVIRRPRPVPKEHLTLAGQPTPPRQERKMGSSGRIRHHQVALGASTEPNSPFVPPPTLAKKNSELGSSSSTKKSVSFKQVSLTTSAPAAVATADGSNAASSSPASSTSAKLPSLSPLPAPSTSLTAALVSPHQLNKIRSSSATTGGSQMRRANERDSVEDEELAALSSSFNRHLGRTSSSSSSSGISIVDNLISTSARRVRSGSAASMGGRSTFRLSAPPSIGLVDNGRSPSHAFDEEVHQLVRVAAEGLRAGYAPLLADEGTGGAYFLFDGSGSPCAVFKPRDEEPMQPNNPRAYLEHFARKYNSNNFNNNNNNNRMPPPASPLLFRERARTWAASSILASSMEPVSPIASRSSIPAGQAACREVIAYMLDREGRAGVPATALVQAEHEDFFDLAEEELLASSPADQWSAMTKSKSKIGSCQQFVISDGDCEELPMKTIQQFPVHQVHKIAVLDLLLFNTDRHGGNILVQKNPTLTSLRATSSMKDSADSSESRKSSSNNNSNHSSSSDVAAEYQLTPIDHGYTLPENFAEAWFEWLTWPQASEPFDESTRHYIASLSWRADAAILRKFHAAVSPGARFVHRVALLWLQAGARANLSPGAIGAVVCRAQLDKHSRLERLIAMAKRKLGAKAVSVNPDAPEESPFWRTLQYFFNREASSDRARNRSQIVTMESLRSQREDEEEDDFDEDGDALSLDNKSEAEEADDKRLSPVSDSREELFPFTLDS